MHVTEDLYHSSHLNINHCKETFVILMNAAYAWNIEDEIRFYNIFTKIADLNCFNLIFLGFKFVILTAEKNDELNNITCL